MERNDKFFLLSLVSLAASLFLFPLALYLLPQAWLGWNYHIPDFLLNFNDYLQASFGLTHEKASWAIFYLLFLSGLIFSGLAYYAAIHTRIDVKKSLPHESTNEAEVRLKQAKQNNREIFVLVIKIFFISLLVFSMAEIVQWAISVSPE